MPNTCTGQSPPHLIRGGDLIEEIDGMRGGAGAVLLRRYRFEGAPAPANFVCYEIPPGSEEGIHTHFRDDRNGTGAYDEFYYVIAGRGLMTVGNEKFEVNEGDAVFAPLDLPRGIRNIDIEETLRIHLTFVQR